VLAEYGIREQQDGFDAVGKLEGKFDFCWKWTAFHSFHNHSL
jgi:hypothetical protein